MLQFLPKDVLQAVLHVLAEKDRLQLGSTCRALQAASQGFSRTLTLHFCDSPDDAVSDYESACATDSLCPALGEEQWQLAMRSANIFQWSATNRRSFLSWLPTLQAVPRATILCFISTRAGFELLTALLTQLNASAASGALASMHLAVRWKATANLPARASKAARARNASLAELELQALLQRLETCAVSCPLLDLGKALQFLAKVPRASRVALSVSEHVGARHGRQPSKEDVSGLSACLLGAPWPASMQHCWLGGAGMYQLSAWCASAEQALRAADDAPPDDEDRLYQPFAQNASRRGGVEFSLVLLQLPATLQSLSLANLDMAPDRESNNFESFSLALQRLQHLSSLTMKFQGASVKQLLSAASKLPELRDLHIDDENEDIEIQYIYGLAEATPAGAVTQNDSQFIAGQSSFYTPSGATNGTAGAGMSSGGPSGALASASTPLKDAGVAVPVPTPSLPPFWQLRTLGMSNLLSLPKVLLDATASVTSLDLSQNGFFLGPVRKLRSTLKTLSKARGLRSLKLDENDISLASFLSTHTTLACLTQLHSLSLARNFIFEVDPLGDLNGDAASGDGSNSLRPQLVNALGTVTNALPGLTLLDLSDCSSGYSLDDAHAGNVLEAVHGSMSLQELRLDGLLFPNENESAEMCSSDDAKESKMPVPALTRLSCLDVSWRGAHNLQWLLQVAGAAALRSKLLELHLSFSMRASGGSSAEQAAQQGSLWAALSHADAILAAGGSVQLVVPVAELPEPSGVAAHDAHEHRPTTRAVAQQASTRPPSAADQSAAAASQQSVGASSHALEEQQEGSRAQAGGDRHVRVDAEVVDVCVCFRRRDARSSASVAAELTVWKHHDDSGDRDGAPVLRVHVRRVDLARRRASVGPRSEHASLVDCVASGLRSLSQGSVVGVSDSVADPKNIAGHTSDATLELIALGAVATAGLSSRAHVLWTVEEYGGHDALPLGS